jgi:hypothetical protein
LISAIGQFVGYILDIYSLLEASGSQIPPTGYCAAISHLQDPGPCTPFRAIESVSDSVYQNENILKQVVGFGGVTQNPICDTANQPCVSFEQEGQCIPIP